MLTNIAKFAMIAILMAGVSACSKNDYCEECEIIDPDYILDDYEVSCETSDDWYQFTSFRSHCYDMAAQFSDVTCTCNKVDL